ncbi:MAG: histidine kinase dimerization/phospho-acceptor domain-containing protein, partial [Candidatus Omnitrophota bacterium]
MGRESAKAEAQKSLPSDLRRQAARRAANRVALVTHTGAYVAVNGFLALIWLFTGAGYFWPIWPILGWGLGLALHAFAARIIPNYARRLYQTELARMEREYQAVTERNVDLESMVRERTRALEEANGQLADSNEKLKEVDGLKTDFLSNVSHELRTPLTAIKGAADNILDGIGGDAAPKHKNYLLRIRSNADRLVRMINDM